MADSDPPDEIDDGESPPDGDGHAPDADALQKKIADRVEHHHREYEAQTKAHEPAVRSGTRQHDRADLFCDRAEGVARLDHRRALRLYRHLVLLVHTRISVNVLASRCHPERSRSSGVAKDLSLHSYPFSNSGFGFRTSARYVVRGRVLVSASRL